jgi:hypothetical protein
MTIDRGLAFSILKSAVAAGYAGPARAQACTRQGIDVACDDGKRVHRKGKDVVPMDNPSAPNRACWSIFKRSGNRFAPRKRVKSTI